MIHPRPPARIPPRDDEWDSCCRCGDFYNEVEIRFKIGAIEPAIGATLTGVTSGDTGVVDTIVIESGAWGGTAIGTITLTSATGVDDDGAWGEDGELLRRTGENMMTLNGEGIQKSYGRLWPMDQLTKRNGKYWCPQHYVWKFYLKDLDDAKINIPDRGGI
jgi:hypothetical protein